MSEWNNKIIEEFRANEGRVGGGFEGATLLLLHTTGAKSGLERVNPVMTLPDGEGYFIIASKGGADTHPDWYYNILAHPEVTVELGTEQFKARASIAEEPKRSELYTRMENYRPGFKDYRNKTSRTIPVVILTPM